MMRGEDRGRLCIVDHAEWSVKLTSRPMENPSLEASRAYLYAIVIHLVPIDLFGSRPPVFTPSYWQIVDLRTACAAKYSLVDIEIRPCTPWHLQTELFEPCQHDVDDAGPGPQPSEQHLSISQPISL